MNIRNFHIHGDNIVECERFLELLNIILDQHEFKKEIVKSSFICPKFTFQNSEMKFNFQFLPGMTNNSDKTSKSKNQRWNKNILDVVKKRGGPLREAADILFTEIINSEEKPLVAIEYCSALPAGNQAWQRSGRSYSYGKAKIPLLYIVDIGGYELGLGREKKGMRLPTSTVPFSYISFSELNNIQVNQIFMCNFGTSEETRKKFNNIFGEKILINYIEEILFHSTSNQTLEEIRKKQFQFVLNTSLVSDTKKFNTSQWENFFTTVTNNKSVIDFIENEGLENWSKKFSIDTTDSFKDHINVAKKLCLGITQNDLPFCLLPGKKRKKYLEQIKSIYSNRLTDEFYEWIQSSEAPLILCWIAGFKPKGDDSRPDRGLLPLCRMLLGENVDILTIVYGPAPISSLNSLKFEPKKLQINGLWQAILDASNGLVVDSKTSENLDYISFLKKNWEPRIWDEEIQDVENINSPYVKPYPIVFSENDVDSLIHNFFKKYQEADVCFELSCNPPGGDWSGISYFNKTDNLEYRWLTLPRVGEKEAKRPDHVIQIFDKEKIYILSIESKNWPNNIELDIGLQLSRYVKTLFSLNCNASREHKNIKWSDNIFTVDNTHIVYASGIAFLGQVSCPKKLSIENKILLAENRSNSDISFTINLVDGNETLEIKALTIIGKQILSILKSSSDLFKETELELNFI